jgi:hypothetical protein
MLALLLWFVFFVLRDIGTGPSRDRARPISLLDPRAVERGNTVRPVRRVARIAGRGPHTHGLAHGPDRSLASHHERRGSTTTSRPANNPIALKFRSGR